MLESKSRELDDRVADAERGANTSSAIKKIASSAGSLIQQKPKMTVELMHAVLFDRRVRRVSAQIRIVLHLVR